MESAILITWDIGGVSEKLIPFVPLEHLCVNRQIAVPAGSTAAVITQGITAHAWRRGSLAFGQLVSRGLESRVMLLSLGHKEMPALLKFY